MGLFVQTFRPSIFNKNVLFRHKYILRSILRGSKSLSELALNKYLKAAPIQGSVVYYNASLQEPLSNLLKLKAGAKCQILAQN